MDASKNFKKYKSKIFFYKITDHELENLLHYRSNMYAPSADVILPQNNMKNIVFTIWIIFKQHLDYNEYYIKT